MKKVYFITRTLPEANDGGGIVRRGQIEYLNKNGYEVIIVAPYPQTIISEKRILIKGVASRHSFRANVLMARFGLKWDYLENWANDAYKILSPIIKKEDVILATSGGELGTLILASLLKNSIGCRVVLNLHDPVSYTSLKGKFSNEPKFYVHPRDKKEKDVFGSVDNIVTSSVFYAEWLRTKYPEIKDRISCHHFGYIQKMERPQRELLKNQKLNVVYGGAMGKLQSPQILVQVAKNFRDVQFTFVGNVTFVIPEMMTNIVVLPKMAYSDYIDYLVDYADIGFFSLTGHIAQWCVPSKLYEYINAGIPMLATIQGDARSIVKDNDFGEVCDYSVVNISDALSRLMTSNRLKEVKDNILEKRDLWHMEYTIKELIKYL